MGKREIFLSFIIFIKKFVLIVFLKLDSLVNLSVVVEVGIYLIIFGCRRIVVILLALVAFENWFSGHVLCSFYYWTTRLSNDSGTLWKAKTCWRAIGSKVLKSAYGQLLNNINKIVWHFLHLEFHSHYTVISLNHRDENAFATFFCTFSPSVWCFYPV